MSSPSQIRILLLSPEDNEELAKLIRQVMTEFGCVGPGYSIMDAEVDAMYETYCRQKHIYFVLKNGKKVVGGGGIGPLTNSGEAVCELKKMYFLPEIRNRGYGHLLLATLIEEARKMGYKKCYLETVARMEQANTLYQTNGFKPLDAPLGATGHHSCERYYLKNL